MIFSQADREIILSLDRALTGLRLDVGVKANSTGKNPLSLHVRLNDAFALLNELGVAVGRIEARFVAADKKLEMIFLGSNPILEQIKTNNETVNRRADELLDTVRGRNDITNNAIVALSGRLSGLEKNIDDMRLAVDHKMWDAGYNAGLAATTCAKCEKDKRRKQRKARRKKK